MKRYPDPYRFFERYLRQAGEQRIRELKRAGYTTVSQEHLNRLMEQDLEECKKHYIQKAEKVLDHNLKVLVRNYRIRRLCREFCLIACPQFAIHLASMAWYSFTHSWGWIVGTYCIVAAFGFLGMFLLGWIWDRRRRSGSGTKCLLIRLPNEYLEK